MEGKKGTSLFVDDGSFMEKFKQLQQEEQKEKEKGAQFKSGPNASVTSTPKLVINRPMVSVKANSSPRTSPAASSGKLAFSLKQKSKLAAPPVKFDEDEEEEDKEAGSKSHDGAAKHQKLDESDSSQQPARLVDVDTNGGGAEKLGTDQMYALLKQQMDAAAKSEDYKEAARLRDSLKMLEDEEPVLRLKKLLKEAIDDEKFEDAVRYRNELNEIDPHSLLNCSSDSTTLTHMVFSEHDADFLALNRQLQTT